MHYRTIAPAALALLAAVLGGCQKSPKDRLQGRWVGKQVENFPAPEAARAQGWATHTSFEFRGSRVRVSIPAESPREGTYKIARVDESDLTVEFLRPHGGADAVELALEGEDTLRWKLGDGRAILLERAD